ncbi:MAG: NAD(P)H-dependent oxidoreductase [Actinomycetota bacterium]|nr:NAD(P)H-dependent oxidoreductase [Actinomycetota bacterium]
MTSTLTIEKRPHVVGIGGTLRDGSNGLRALERALAAAEEAGATTELLDLRELDLPMYEPGRPLEGFGESAEMLLQAMRSADAMLWSTAAYHGTLAGVTKNALDFAQFMARDEKPYLQDKIVGLVATAGGSMAAVNAINAMVNVVHALRGVAAPLSVPIAQSWRVFDDEGKVNDEGVASHLESLGRLIVEMATKLGDQEAAGRTLRTVA